MWWLAVAAAPRVCSHLSVLPSCGNQTPLAPHPLPRLLAASASKPPVVSSTPSVAAEPARRPRCTRAYQDSLLTVTVDTLGAPTYSRNGWQAKTKGQAARRTEAKFGADHPERDHFPLTRTQAGTGSTSSTACCADAIAGAKPSCRARKIEVDGSASDVRNGWMDKLKTFFGAGFTDRPFDVKQDGLNAKESVS